MTCYPCDIKFGTLEDSGHGPHLTLWIKLRLHWPDDKVSVFLLMVLGVIRNWTLGAIPENSINIFSIDKKF